MSIAEKFIEDFIGDFFEVFVAINSSLEIRPFMSLSIRLNSSVRSVFALFCRPVCVNAGFFSLDFVPNTAPTSSV